MKEIEARAAVWYMYNVEERRIAPHRDTVMFSPLGGCCVGGDVSGTVSSSIPFPAGGGQGKGSHRS